MSELYHYGIRGQKWGVRRYQNEDGTLTEEGRKRLANNLISTQSKSQEKFIKEVNRLKAVKQFNKSNDLYSKARKAQKRAELEKNRLNERASKAAIKAQKKSKDPNAYIAVGVDYIKNPDNRTKYNLRMDEMIKARNNYIQESEKFINNLLGDYAKTPSQNINTSYVIYDNNNTVRRVYPELGNLMRGAMYTKLRRGSNV